MKTKSRVHSGCICFSQWKMTAYKHQFKSRRKSTDMDSELICPLCEDEYQQENPPRLLTGCGHSYCQNCLKKIMTEKKGSFKIVCPEDGEMVTLKDSSMSNFPKNIALLKIIESKSNSLSFKDSSLEMSKIVKAEEAQEDEDDRDLVNALMSEKNATTSDDNIHGESTVQAGEMCLLHQKPLEVVCIMDLKKICANCAIFGEHKGHEFKSLEEIESERMTYYHSIIDIMDKKEAITSRISNQETCSSIMDILENKKEKMKRSITEKYKKLLQTIETKQNESLKNLNTLIQKTETKLKNLMRIDGQLLEKYETWEEKSYNQIKILEGEDFEKKLMLLFCEGNERDTEDVIDEGDLLILDMNKQEQNLITEVESALDNIGVEFNQEVFNHIDGFVEIYDEAKKKKSKRVPNKTETSSKAQQKKQQQVEQPKSLNNATKKEALIDIPCQPKKIVTVDHNHIHGAEESLLEQDEEIMVKKPEWVKHESPQLNEPKEESIDLKDKKVEFSTPSVNEKKKVIQSVESLRKQVEEKSLRGSLKKENKKDMSFEKFERPNKKKLSKVKVPEKYEKIIDGIANDSLELVDLTNAELGDAAIITISQFLNGSKAKTVKLIRNKLNDETMSKILPYIGGIITLNLSQNLLTDRVLDILIEGRDYMPSMKNIILSQNKIIERKHKTKIEKLRSLDLTVSV